MKNEKLAPWVKFIWQLSVSDAELHYKLLPTDCIDVIINLAGDMIYEVEKQKLVAPRFHINGLRRKHSYIHQENTVLLYGISFYPYGLYPFVNKSITGLQNAIIDLFDFAPDMAGKLEQAVETVKNRTASDVITGIEQALLSVLAVKEDFPEKAGFIFEFMTADIPLTVKDFCDSRSLNIKTFERMVLSCTGFTPKTLQNIRRFQIAGNQLTHNPAAGLAGIALDNQFADQAHFTKEFRHFSGASPRKFISEKKSVKENAAYLYL